MRGLHVTGVRVKKARVVLERRQTFVGVDLGWRGSVVVFGPRDSTARGVRLFMPVELWRELGNPDRVVVKVDVARPGVGYARKGRRR